MPLVEGQGIKDGVDEVKRKFLPTYKVGVCVVDTRAPMYGSL